MCVQQTGGCWAALCSHLCHGRQPRKLRGERSGQSVLSDSPAWQPHHTGVSQSIVSHSRVSGAACCWAVLHSQVCNRRQLPELRGHRAAQIVLVQIPAGVTPMGHLVSTPSLTWEQSACHVNGCGALTMCPSSPSVFPARSVACRSILPLVKSCQPHLQSPRQPPVCMDQQVSRHRQFAPSPRLLLYGVVASSRIPFQGRARKTHSVVQSAGSSRQSW